MAKSKGDYLQVENDPLTARTTRGAAENGEVFKRDNLNSLFPSQPSLHEFEFRENLAGFFDNRGKQGDINTSFLTNTAANKIAAENNLGKIFPLIRKKTYIYEPAMRSNSYFFFEKKGEIV